jgi:hypothetical protein
VWAIRADSSMTAAPKGFRRAEDENLFRQRANDPAIVPDRVSPSVEGYFRIPAVWIGETPEPSIVAVLNPAIHHAAALGKDLSLRHADHQCG